MIHFNRPQLSRLEEDYVLESLRSGHVRGDGPFTKRCHQWLKTRTGAQQVLLTHSCTAALEMATLLADLKPGDEVILPSYTFTSTANAVALRGAIPVFVDVRRDTANLDETKIEAALTTKTKAIIVVHYAGVACEMDRILELARQRQIPVIEDAAQGVDAFYKGRPLGTLGDAGCFSFHETKNVVSGEGGALITSRADWAERAEVLREKGTNRNQFIRGQVDKYTWTDLGSSYLPSELIAAVLAAQLERIGEIQKARIETWAEYHSGLEHLEAQEKLRRPIVPADCEHNAHMYYILTASTDQRSQLTEFLRGQNVQAVSHYVPLHSSPAGRKFGRTAGELKVTDDIAERLLRLPLYFGFNKAHHVINVLNDFYRRA